MSQLDIVAGKDRPSAARSENQISRLVRSEETRLWHCQRPPCTRTIIDVPSLSDLQTPLTTFNVPRVNPMAFQISNKIRSDTEVVSLQPTSNPYPEEQGMQVS